MARTFTAREIAEHTGGSVKGDPERRISRIASIESAGPTDLVFAEGVPYLQALERSRAGVALVPDGFDVPPGMTSIQVRHPALAIARALELLHPRERTFRGVSPGVHLGEGVQLGDDVGIGPGVYVGDRTRVGRGTEIHPCVTLARDVVVGEDCVIHSGVHVYPDVRIGDRVVIHAGCVIGGDGFGYVQERCREDGVRHRKVQQIGTLEIGDDVDIGANTTIDRGALDATLIGRGTKIDNLVMIGHNVRVGDHCLLVAQVGIAGSTVLDHHVTVAGQAGLVGHLKIGSGAIIGAQSGVTKDIPEGGSVFGTPAMDLRKARKALSLLEHLPEYRKILMDLARRLERLEGADGAER